MLPIEDVIKALEVCLSPPSTYKCVGCPLHDTEGNCLTALKITSLNTIKNIWKKNQELTAEIKRLKNEMSYMVNPNTVGDKHEMGCW